MSGRAEEENQFKSLADFPSPPLFRSFALTLASSLLYILSFPNFNLSCFAWVALVPLSLLSITTTPRSAFLWGWLSGTIAYSGILYWLLVTFHAAHLSAILGIFCLLILAGYLGLYWAAWALALSRLQKQHITNFRGQSPQTNITHHWGLSPEVHLMLYFPFVGAAAWVALEYLRTYLFSGFPWALLADSQVRVLPLIQIASITGVYGVSFLVVWVNLTIAQWRLRTALLSFGVLALAGFYGNHRLEAHAHESTGQPIRVALLQGNIDQYKKWNKTYIEEIEKTYENLAETAARSSPDMILWPETSVPGYLLQDPPLRDWLQKTIRKTGKTHLVGAPVMHAEKAYNSAFSINPEGQLEGEYAKQHLVPFGEIVPWSNVLSRFIKVLNDLGGFVAGEQSPVVSVAGYPVGVSICYEAIFPNLVRQSAKQGAVLLANITNDGWYLKTAAPYQHWAPNVFRAVENDRWLIRADNTGISGIIDPTGHVIATSSLFQSEIVRGEVYPRSTRTFYSRWGDWFSWLCTAAVFIFCI